MSDLVGNPEDRFSHNEAHLLFVVLGELTDFREKNERRGAIVDVKVSPSRYEITGSLH